MKRLQNVTSWHAGKPWRIVTVWVALLLVLLLADACCPCRHIATSTADSIRIETHTRTEYVSDTVFIEVPAETTSQTVAEDYSHLETQFAVSDARIEPDGRLFHSLQNKQQNAPVAVETPVIYRDSIVYRNRTVNNIVEVKQPLTTWQRFQLSGFWVLAAVAMCIIAFYIKKRFIL